MLLLRMVLALGAMLLGLVLDSRDGGGAPPAEDDSGEPPEDGGGTGEIPPEHPRDDEGRFYRVLKFESKEDADAHYNNVFKQRHRRMKDDLRKEIEDDIREEVRAEYADDKEAAEQATRRRSTRLTNLQNRVTELEGLVDEAEVRAEEAEDATRRYENIVKKQWDEVKGVVPDYVMEFIQDRDLLWRIDYVRRNRDKWEHNGSGEETPEAPETPEEPETVRTFVIGSPPTPRGGNRQDRQSQADQEAQQEFMRAQHSAV